MSASYRITSSGGSMGGGGGNVQVVSSGDMSLFGGGDPFSDPFFGGMSGMSGGMGGGGKRSRVVKIKSGGGDVDTVRYSTGWGTPEPAQERKEPPRVLRIRSQNYAEIKKKCLEEGALWEDPDFPATQRSVYYSPNPNKFEWKRPKEICDEPHMFVGGATRFDIVQGDLGNCWFLAAVASLCATRKKELMDKVFPGDNSFTRDYAGVFHFRFWQYGKWVEVVVDDRLPTLHGRLCFVHSSERNEFWSALLEKAYAKLNGSYEAMIGGNSAEAMEDFTGGICETFKLRQNAPKDLFQVMKKGFARSSMMGCTIDARGGQIEGVQANGLIQGHAYSITDVKTADVRGRKVNLVRIRNPWGNQYEWKGAWGDKSAEWTMLSDDERDRLGIKNEDDGEFWMNFDDFVNSYDNIEINHLSPGTVADEAARGERRFNLNLETGSWKRGINAGGCRNYLDTFWTNPQYRIEVTDADEEDDEDLGTLIVGLMQKETRKKKANTGADLLTIGYMIYPVSDPKTGPLDMNFFKYNGSKGKSTFSNMREVVGRHKLPPGNYVVVPCTFQPKEEGDFILRLFTEKPANENELDEETGFVPEDEKVKDDIPIHHPGSEPEARRRRARAVTQDDVDDEKKIRDVFKRTAGADLEVDACELRQILNSTYTKDVSAENFSLETCRSIVAMLDVDRSGKLGYEEFKKMWTDLRRWRKVFSEFDKDKNGTFNSYELRQALNSAGFRVSNATFSCLVLRYGDKEGRIYFDDFMLCAIKMRTMCDLFKDISVGGPTANFSLDEFVQTTMYS